MESTKGRALAKLPIDFINHPLEVASKLGPSMVSQAAGIALAVASKIKNNNLKIRNKARPILLVATDGQTITVAHHQAWRLVLAIHPHGYTNVIFQNNFKGFNQRISPGQAMYCHPLTGPQSICAR